MIGTVKNRVQVHLDKIRQKETDTFMIFVCPMCGHYETEDGEAFTTTDGTCPVWSVANEDVHNGHDEVKLAPVTVRRA